MIVPWYQKNIQMLERLFGPVSYDGMAYNWVLIHSLALPPTFHQHQSNFLIKTPGADIENHKAYDFYMNKYLTRLDGRERVHLFNDDWYNDLRENNFARLSFHLRSFRPTPDVVSGDTLADIVQAAYNFLAEREWK